MRRSLQRLFPVMFLLAVLLLAGVALSAEVNQPDSAQAATPEPERVTELTGIARDYAVSLGIKPAQGQEQTAVMTLRQFLDTFMGGMLCSMEGRTDPSPNDQVLAYLFIGYGEVDFFNEINPNYRGDVTFAVSVDVQTGELLASSGQQGALRIDLREAATLDQPCVEPGMLPRPEMTVQPEATIEPEATVQPEATLEPEATPELE